MSKKFIDGMNKTFKIVDKFKDSPMKYKILDNMEKEIKNKVKNLVKRLDTFKKKNLVEVSWEGETCLVPKKKKNYHIVSGFEGVETLIPEQEDENYDDKLKAQDHLDEIKTIEKINK